LRESFSSPQSPDPLFHYSAAAVINVLGYWREISPYGAAETQARAAVILLLRHAALRIPGSTASVRKGAMPVGMKAPRYKRACLGHRSGAIAICQTARDLISARC
jgi:hypothetical protein